MKLNYDSVAGFKEAYNTKFEQAKINPFNDSTLFSRLVFPKLIARYARTFGYKVIEHLAAYYSRQRDDESNYYMLIHTLELEPLTPTQEQDTFFPCFDKVPENEHQEKTPNGTSRTPENSPHPPAPSPNLGRGGADGVDGLNWGYPSREASPLSQSWERGAGGVRAVFGCATFSDWRKDKGFADRKQHR